MTADPAADPFSLPIITVVGPTATGKSTLGVELAEALHGEVVNADSMQLYRGLDIGTAKPTVAEQRGIPHHLFELWDVTETASVAVYQQHARRHIDDVIGRGCTPILIGGSGLYIRAVLDELEFPGTDPGVRARLESELAEHGAEALHTQLAASDPGAAAAILPTNGRRIVRALEVIETTGRPFTATLPEYRYARPALQVGIDVPMAASDRRITARVTDMFDRGLVGEVERLIPQGLREGKTASRALGYAQVLDLLDGRLALDQARAETVRATRRFARRQRSWFRRDPRIEWLTQSDDLAAQAIDLARRTIDA